MQSCVGLRICFGWWSIGINVHYVLDSKVGSRSLHVLSTAQADAESSVTAWPTRLCGWPVCFEEDLSGGMVVVPNMWWHWLNGVYCIVFLFLIVVPSYLLVHSICTKKLDWWAAVCLFREEWNSVFFLFLSAVIWLAYVL